MRYGRELVSCTQLDSQRIAGREAQLSSEPGDQLLRRRLREHKIVVIGIDVAADRLNYVVLSDDGAVVDGNVCAADDLVELRRLSAGADVIAVDAPAQLSDDAHAHDDPELANKFRSARCAEIALGRNYRIWVPWPTPAKGPLDPWMQTGLGLFQLLRASSQAEVIEVFPYAAFRVFAHPDRLAKKTTAAGVQQRVAALHAAGFTFDKLALWSHDSLDAAAAAVVALDRARNTAVQVSCGHDDSAIWLPAAAATRALIEPRWPAERFFLQAIPEGWTLGPFAVEDWIVAPDGSIEYNDSIVHPIRLRVRRHERLLLHANNGGLSDMSYRIVPLSDAPPSWL